MEADESLIFYPMWQPGQGLRGQESNFKSNQSILKCKFFKQSLLYNFISYGFYNTIGDKTEPL